MYITIFKNKEYIMKNMKISEYMKKNKSILFRFILLIFLTLSLSGFVMSKFSIVDTQPYTISQTQWEIQKNIETNTVTYTKDITKDLLNQSLLFYVENAYIDISINDNVEYHFGKTTSVSKSPGTTWVLYNIEDEDSLGKQLTISIRYVYGIPDSMINIYLGPANDLILSKIKSELPDLITNVLLGFISILFLFLYWVNEKYHFYKKKNKSPLCYGLISLFLLLMSNCNLYFLQIFLSKGIGQYYLYYLTFFAIPIVLLIYNEDFDSNNLNIEFLSYMIFVSIIMCLQIFNIIDFAEIIGVYYIFCIAEFIFAFYKIKISGRTEKTPFVLNTVVILLLFFILTCYIQETSDIYKFKAMMIVKIGFLYYTCCELYKTIKNTISNIRIMYRDAYTDALTGVGNRNYFYKNLQLINLKDVGITYFDINNLKYYNDNFGHTYGDLLIQNATILMCSVYGNKNVYRIGGDEFIILQEGLTLEKQLKLQSAFIKKVKEYNSKNKINKTPYLEMACGNTIYQKGDKKYSDIIERADRIMYENKSYLKSKYDSQIYERR